MLRHVIWLSLAVACDDTLPGEVTAVYGDCPEAQELEGALDAVGFRAVTAWTIKEIDPSEFARATREGTAIELPALDANGNEATITVATVAEASPYADELKEVVYRGDVDRTDALDAAPAYTLGCTDEDTCGVVTMLDSADAKDAGQIEAMIVDPDVGWVIIESVDSLLGHLGEAPDLINPKCAVVYNAASHTGLEFAEEGDDGSPLEPTPGDGVVNANIPIVLDADATFYELHDASVFARQASILNAVNVVYSGIEPATSGDWTIRFQVIGQETWTTGFGPTTTDIYDLSDEINDLDYSMATHPANNQLSYFFVGYDITGGYGGVAGGVCNVDGYDDTFSSAEKHQDNHALGQQVYDTDGGYEFATFYGRTVVAVHEIGHMIGATHGAGEKDECGEGILSSMCGTTLMLSGAAGGVAPDFRVPFFSKANDDNILACVDEVY